MLHSDPTAQAFQELALHYEITLDQELRKAWGMSYSGFVEQLLRFAGIQDNDRVLDIATGTGLIPRTLISMFGSEHHITGLDITYPALHIGRTKLASNRETKSITFTCATATALPFAPASFDCVICALATHHIHQHQLLEQVSSVLKPGGQVILADVSASPSWRFPGVKSCLRLAALLYFLITVSPARAWVESQAVTSVYTEKEWVTALREYNFSATRVHKPFIQHTWAPSAIMIAATKGAV